MKAATTRDLFKSLKCVFARRASRMYNVYKVCQVGRKIVTNKHVYQYMGQNIPPVSRVQGVKLYLEQE